MEGHTKVDLAVRGTDMVCFTSWPKTFTDSH